MRRIAVLPSSRLRTAVNSIRSRTMVMSNGSSSPSRTTVMTISDPTSPRIRSTACSSVRPSSDWPSTWVMKSPASTPASIAGVSSIGVMTLTKPSSIVTSMPRPPNSPRVWVCIASKSRGGR